MFKVVHCNLVHSSLCTVFFQYLSQVDILFTSNGQDDQENEHLYECQIDKLDNGTQTTINIPLQLNELEITDGIKGIVKENDYLKMQTKVSLDPTCGLPPGRVRFDKSVVLEYHLYTRYSVKGSVTQNDRLEHEMKNTHVSHYYKLQNLGPSITNKNHRFTLALPKGVNENINEEPNSQLNCSKSTTTGSLGKVIGVDICSHALPTSRYDFVMSSEFVQYKCIVGK